MIPANELRIGNRVFWKPTFLQPNVDVPTMPIEIIAIETDNISYIPLHLEHRVEPFEDDLMANETHNALLTEIDPIPLNPAWLMHLPALQYPEEIKFVHQLQNWYFSNYNKELWIND